MEQKIGWYFWLRVVVMICTLVAVLILIKRLNSGELIAAGGAKAFSIDLCPTRVSSASLIGQFAIIQEGMKWYRTGTERSELDQIAVEKWFGEHCAVDAQLVEANPDASPLLTFAYIKGDPKTLLMSPEGVFTFDGLHFRSPSLASALSEFESLPPPKKPGQK